MGQLGANAHGEVLEAGRVSDCTLACSTRATMEPAGVLVVAPAGLLHAVVPQPDGTALYELLAGHPDRAPGELVFLADLAVELCAWPHGTWASLAVNPQAAADAVIAGWHRGQFKGLRLDRLTAQEALALEQPRP